ncbi:DUF2637 domain-containing protein [Micromonospora sp. NPDC047730]|uniref:DUF2637 domain-containing protein n=1 Tax=Micromonospora sp. NPDC047730 TaxID=3364253 RepID=UPI0037230D4B
MIDAMRPASEATRPRGHEAADGANEAATVGQDEAGPREADEASTARPTEAAASAGLNGADPMRPGAVRQAPAFKASRTASNIAARGQRAIAEAEAEAIRLRAHTEQKVTVEATKARQAEAREAKRLARKEARRAAMREAVARTLGAAGRAVTYAREHADSVYSMGIYGAAVGVAGTSQAQVAHDLFDWSWPRAIGGAAFIEGLALAFALTAHKQRMQGEKAFLLRGLTATAAGFGAWVNYTAHAGDPSLEPWVAQVMGVVLAASSIAGIVLWEMRTNARTRKELRKAEKKAAPKASLGLDLALRYPGTAFWAWSAMVARPWVRNRAEAIRVGAEMRAERAERIARKKQRRQVARANAILRKAAAKAAVKAGKKGDAGLALTHLARVAEVGSEAFAGQPALEASPATGAGLTIDGSLVPAGLAASEANAQPRPHEASPASTAPLSRPRPHEAGLAGVASPAPASRPQSPEAGLRVLASPASGLMPQPHEAGLAGGGAGEAGAGTDGASGPGASSAEASASHGGAGEAEVGDLRAARNRHDSRVNELDLMFPDCIPSRNKVKALVKLMTAAGEPPLNAWTSNRDIDNAIKALRERRSRAA